jgi:predicted dehydrogenase
MRVSVIGVGKMGAHHARVFARHATLTALHDVDVSRAKRAVDACGGKVVRNEEEAIAEADLVVIATPTALHFDHARQAIAAGRHVLVEKPLCTQEDAAWALCAEAERMGVGLFVGQSERFNPLVQRIRDLTQGETIRAMATRRIVSNPTARDEPCLNLAVHDIDLASFLTSHPVELVRAVRDRSIVEIGLRAGPATIQVVVGYATTNQRSLRVETVEGSHGGDLTGLVVGGAEPLDLQARAVLDAAVGRPSTVASGVDGARAVSLARRAASLAFDAAMSAAE